MTNGQERKAPRISKESLFNWKTIIVVWIVFFLVQAVIGTFGASNEISYSEFKKYLAAGQIEQVRVGKVNITGTYFEIGGKEQKFQTVRVEDPKLLEQLQDKKIEVTGVRETRSTWSTLLVWVVPVALFWFVFQWFRRNAPGTRGFGLGTIGRSKAKLYMEKDVPVTFKDVAGVDEAKEELSEVIEFLNNPKKFERIGGKLPKGILLVGPPGTGKTLLARAVAGEGQVPFFSISGSEFVEMFVGVGAARVRDLFNEAKQVAPCIIFIDELDALGKARGVSINVHEEREQTLNQLLVELDGFDPRVGVVLMAATNRPEILDPALLRSGRFDRQVLVDRPDRPGRLAILKLHAREIQLEEEADLKEIASMTVGFTGADLANIVNEAALLAVREDKDSVGIGELREAVERVIAGLQKKNRVLTPDERERVAHHEIGHAVVALMLPGSDTVQKISIIPRGISALGYTLQLPTNDRFVMTQGELEDKVAILLAGRAAEEVVYGGVSTGAQDDLRKATEIARGMVEDYGMSKILGKVSLQREPHGLILRAPSGAPPGGVRSEETSREVDCEIRRIVDQQHARARQLLEGAEAALRKGAVLLLEQETIMGDRLKEILDSTRSHKDGKDFVARRGAGAPT